MDALILSCGTGGGHNAAGRAVEAELAARGHHAVFLDPYTLKDQKTSHMVSHAYISMAQRAPRAFGALYGLGNAYRKLPVRSPVYHANLGMAKILSQYLEEHPCDAVVTTHLFPAEMITRMKKRGMSTPASFFVATDYTCIPFTEETDCDYYITPAPALNEEFISRGIPAEKIRPLGIPVLPEYMAGPDRTGARRRLGFDSEKLHILVAGGSIGAGSLDETVGTLTESFEGASITVVCGNNADLYERLRQKYASRCEIVRETKRFSDYMKATDIFISKPGGLSSTEAAALGTALIHVTPIPGCETRNMEFFAKRGMCVPVTAPKKELPDACRRLISQPFRERMLQKQRASLPQNAAKTIVDLMEEVTGK